MHSRGLRRDVCTAEAIVGMCAFADTVGPAGAAVGAATLVSAREGGREHGNGEQPEYQGRAEVIVKTGFGLW